MRKDTRATRERIINAAETLFAEQGVDSTSLLEIAGTAGQKNRSALQYHFTNKEGLLDAVLDKHNRQISQSRSQMLDELDRRGNYSLYELIEALVLPMASQLDNRDGGRAFLKIHSQLMSSEAYQALRQRRDRDNPDTQRFFAMATPFMNSENDAGVRARFILTGSMLIHGLAAYLAETSHISRPEFLHTLIQGIVDVLQQAPAASSRE
jgi:AcrR family transcriptional regulator